MTSSAPAAHTIEDVLRFWFEETEPKQHFIKDLAFDQRVRDVLGGLHGQAEAGALEDWMSSAKGCLALCIVLDQAPRNMFRDTPRAFASDAQARQVARHMLDKSFDTQLSFGQRVFAYLPLEHSEERADQARSVALFKALMEEAGAHDPALEERFALTYDYALRHQVIVDRFGRFPHRNAVLGRSSTDEEQAFLSEPGSSF